MKKEKIFSWVTCGLILVSFIVPFLTIFSYQIGSDSGSVVHSHYGIFGDYGDLSALFSLNGQPLETIWMVMNSFAILLVCVFGALYISFFIVQLLKPKKELYKDLKNFSAYGILICAAISVLTGTIATLVNHVAYTVGSADYYLELLGEIGLFMQFVAVGAGILGILTFKEKKKVIVADVKPVEKAPVVKEKVKSTSTAVKKPVGKTSAKPKSTNEKKSSAKKAVASSKSVTKKPTLAKGTTKKTPAKKVSAKK